MAGVLGERPAIDPLGSNTLLPSESVARVVVDVLAVLRSWRLVVMEEMDEGGVERK